MHGALLLHGLSGHADEWAATVSWLEERCRVVAYNSRGVTPDECVAEAVAAIESHSLAPAILIGQSLGGRTAMLVASRRPDLVQAIVVAEAGPDGADPGDLSDLGDRLEAWAARNERVHGIPWPRHDPELMARTLREGASRPYWEEWERIGCPILVVVAENGGFAPGEAEEMARRGRDVRIAEIAGAGHDVHLDAPERWRQAISEFLDGCDGR